MKSILKDKNNSEKLLNMTSDTLILMDRDGVCVDIAIHNVELSRKSCCTEQNPSAIMNSTYEMKPISSNASCSHTAT